MYDVIKACSVLVSKSLIRKGHMMFLQLVVLTRKIWTDTEDVKKIHMLLPHAMIEDVT